MKRTPYTVEKLKTLQLAALRKIGNEYGIRQTMFLGKEELISKLKLLLPNK